MSVFDHPAFDDHEEVLFFSEPETGLRSIIAIHSTALGPGGGGTRFWTYDTSDAALTDALKLSRAMSYKNAMAGLKLGGGKSVLIRPKGAFDRQALFEAQGRAIENAGGRYITAEDVGCTPEDMHTIRTQTKYVAGLSTGAAASGDPSPKTAFGVFTGIRAAAAFKLGSDDLSGRTIAVQGIGNVGFELCRLLYEAGAKLIVTDFNDKALAEAEERFGAITVALDDIFGIEADIFAPCALGGAVNANTIGRLKVKVVAGGANNQLAEDRMGAELQSRDILYAPDYVINGGGIINAAAEVEGAYNEAEIDKKVLAIGDTLTRIFKRSGEEGRPTNQVADEMARAILAEAKAQR